MDKTVTLREVFAKTLENESKMLYSALAGKPLVYLLGKEFAEEYMKQRKEKGIFLKSLRFTTEEVDLPEHRDHNALLKEVRIAHETIEKSVLIWDEWVATVDKEGNCTLQRGSAKMKKWFETKWDENAQ